MLRKFRVNINGKAFVVELEELNAPVGTTSNVAPVPVAPVVPSPPIAPVVAPAPVISGNGITIEAPMPGNILSIKVKVGEKVSFEQALVVLEAMKMENELVAPKAGTVTAIHVTEGSAIDVGKPIITIE